mmetsp:Transcript_13720/g.42481  ORF Transcript_13720/g.42481 Transcript_13720/m.42481 type:complete len:209 (-) Transcript_13720:406-1032(-)
MRTMQNVSDTVVVSGAQAHRRRGRRPRARAPRLLPARAVAGGVRRHAGVRAGRVFVRGGRGRAERGPRVDGMPRDEHGRPARPSRLALPFPGNERGAQVRPRARVRPAPQRAERVVRPLRTGRVQGRDARRHRGRARRPVRQQPDGRRRVPRPPRGDARARRGARLPPRARGQSQSGRGARAAARVVRGALRPDDGRRRPPRGHVAFH